MHILELFGTELFDAFIELEDATADGCGSMLGFILELLCTTMIHCSVNRELFTYVTLLHSLQCPLWRVLSRIEINSMRTQQKSEFIPFLDCYSFDLLVSILVVQRSILNFRPRFNVRTWVPAKATYFQTRKQ